MKKGSLQPQVLHTREAKIMPDYVLSRPVWITKLINLLL